MRIEIFFLTLLIYTFHSNAETSKISVEAYGKLPVKSMFVISPNSERLAHRDTSNGRDLVIITDLVKRELIGVVNVSSVKPSHMYFIDDDTLIFVASKNSAIKGFRGRHEISSAFVYQLKKKKIHPLLTRGNGIYRGQSQLGRIVGISPDKKYAYMPAYGNKDDFHLYKVRLDWKSKPRILQRGSSDTIDFFLDGEGNLLARERYDNKKNLHTIESKISGDWVVVFSEEAEYKTKSFNGVTPDRKKLVMIETDKNTGRRAYYTMSLKDGSIQGPVFSREDKDVEAVLTDIQRVVHGVRYSGFTPSYEFFDEKLNTRMRDLRKAMPRNSLTIQDYTPQWNEILLYVDGEQSSGDYLMYKAGKLDYLTAKRPDIPPDSVHKVELYDITARDGLTIPTLLTIPTGTKIEKLPAIMMPHGGPESYDRMSFNYLAQYFADQGYLVIQPQFRGSKGFGAEHLLAGRGEWGRKMQDDLTDAVNDLAKSGKIDKNKVCIVGASYGGYAALAGAVFTPNLYQCVVSINGVSDVEKMMEDEESTYGRNHWVVAYWKDVIAKGGRNHWVVAYWKDVIAKGDVDEEHLKQISPINHVKNIKAHVLLIHSEYDNVVPIHQTEEMFDEMKDQNKDVTFLELEKGDHHLSNAENRMKAMIAIDKFIRKHI